MVLGETNNLVPAPSRPSGQDGWQKPPDVQRMYSSTVPYAMKSLRAINLSVLGNKKAPYLYKRLFLGRSEPKRKNAPWGVFLSIIYMRCQLFFWHCVHYDVDFAAYIVIISIKGWVGLPAKFCEGHST